MRANRALPSFQGGTEGGRLRPAGPAWCVAGQLGLAQNPGAATSTTIGLRARRGSEYLDRYETQVMGCGMLATVAERFTTCRLNYPAQWTLAPGGIWKQKYWLGA
jgi:hypothetical protein